MYTETDRPRLTDRGTNRWIFNTNSPHVSKGGCLARSRGWLVFDVKIW